MVLRYMLALTASIKIFFATLLYLVFMSQVFSKIFNRANLIQHLFINLFRKDKDGTSLGISSILDVNFILETASLLFASDLLSTSILQTAQNGLEDVTKYFSLLVTIFNNITYLFKLILAFSILIFLLRRILFDQTNGDLSKMFSSIVYSILVLTVIVLHIADPTNDFLLGHWK